MLNFKTVEKILRSYNYEYENNILYGGNKVRTKAVVPVGPLILYAQNRQWPYFFRFSIEGINLIRMKNGNADQVEDNILVPWMYIKDLRIRKGIISYSMKIITDTEKLEFFFSKFVVGNDWIKENIKYLQSINFHYNK
ncbi:hypothetical protein [Ohessyouella blattaphilus]